MRMPPKEAQEKAPSAILKSLVEKLRNDLAEKDKKQRAMSREEKTNSTLEGII